MPSASSYAVFSFAHQLARGEPFAAEYWIRYSRISVDGVPG